MYIRVLVHVCNPVGSGIEVVALTSAASLVGELHARALADAKLLHVRHDVWKAPRGSQPPRGKSTGGVCSSVGC
jgi:hypothetical protein